MSMCIVYGHGMNISILNFAYLGGRGRGKGGGGGGTGIYYYYMYNVTCKYVTMYIDAVNARFV